MNKTLVIIRHAHRDTAKGRELNNGLSEKGRRQVRKIFDFFFERFPDMETPVFFSSNKKRCLETLEPLSRKLERKLNTNSCLLERTERETLSQFKARIKKFISQWEKSPAPLTVICTHGDWIPTFFKLLLGTSIDLKKGGWAEVECVEKPQLTWLVQSFE